MSIFYLLIVVLLSGCELFDSEKKNPEPEAEQYFRAELNGQSWSGEPRAAFTFTGTDTILQVFATRFDTTNFPYNDHVSLTMDYNPEKKTYDVLIEYKNTWLFGGAYYENDGDARIARYEPVSSDSNLLMVEINKMDDGKELAAGAFTMTVVIDPGYDDEHNNRYRQQPDTVRITGGEFRVLLEEQK